MITSCRLQAALRAFFLLARGLQCVVMGIRGILPAELGNVIRLPGGDLDVIFLGGRPATMEVSKGLHSQVVMRGSHRGTLHSQVIV